MQDAGYEPKWPLESYCAMEQSEEEVFEDFASDEVGPSVRSGDRLEPPDFAEGEPESHPDYRGLREDDTF